MNAEGMMLFHVTAEHDHMTCPGRAEGPGSDAVRDAQKWLEGNDSVKVLGQWAHQPSHKSFAIIESDDFAAVTALLRSQMIIGRTEVLPVNDGIANRKARGWWGT
jgi:hypothetical protein